MQLFFVVDLDETHVRKFEPPTDARCSHVKLELKCVFLIFSTPRAHDVGVLYALRNYDSTDAVADKILFKDMSMMQ